MIGSREYVLEVHSLSGSMLLVVSHRAVFLGLHCSFSVIRKHEQHTANYIRHIVNKNNFVNDMPDVISSVLLMFADDTKLY